MAKLSLTKAINGGLPWLLQAGGLAGRRSCGADLPTADRPSLRCPRRIRSITSGWRRSMKLTIFICPPHGLSSGSTSYNRLLSITHVETDPGRGPSAAAFRASSAERSMVGCSASRAGNRHSNGTHLGAELGPTWVHFHWERLSGERAPSVLPARARFR